MYYIIELGGQYPAVRRQGRAPLDGCILQEISRLCAFQGRNEVMETVILEKTIIKRKSSGGGAGRWGFSGELGELDKQVNSF